MKLAYVPLEENELLLLERVAREQGYAELAITFHDAHFDLTCTEPSQWVRKRIRPKPNLRPSLNGTAGPPCE